MNDNFDVNFRWAEKRSPPKLSNQINVNRLREARTMLVDEPLFAFAASPLLPNSTQPTKRKLKKQTNKEPTTKITDKINLQPGIDSYIINTIKLNRILKSGLTFDQIECFNNKSNPPAQIKSQPKPDQNVNTDKDARHCLKQFITVMSIHSGFLAATESSFDILIDILESYILSMFKVLKNLQNIHQVSLNRREPRSSLVQPNYYSSSLYLKQALEELGIGTIADVKQFYVNDIINYHRDTFEKVSGMYEKFKARKMAEKGKDRCVKTEGEVKVEEFIRENDFLNDESDLILGELLTNLNETHFDEEMNRLLQTIGDDPFNLMNEEFQKNMQKI